MKIDGSVSFLSRGRSTVCKVCDPTQQSIAVRGEHGCSTCYFGTSGNQLQGLSLVTEQRFTQPAQSPTTHICWFYSKAIEEHLIIALVVSHASVMHDLSPRRDASAGAG
jgi:hypothetical protein